MLLWRRIGERIMIGDDIVLTVVDILGDNYKARIGIEAPLSIPVNRKEVQDRIDADRDAS